MNNTSSQVPMGPSTRRREDRRRPTSIASRCHETLAISSYYAQSSASFFWCEGAQYRASGRRPGIRLVRRGIGDARGEREYLGADGSRHRMHLARWRADGLLVARPLIACVEEI